MDAVREEIHQIAAARLDRVRRFQSHPEEWFGVHLQAVERIRRAAINEAYWNINNGEVHGARRMAKLAADCLVEATKLETPGPSVSPGVSLPYHISSHVGGSGACSWQLCGNARPSWGRPGVKRSEVRDFRLTTESGRRDLNPRRQPWQGCTLPLSYSRKWAVDSLRSPLMSTRSLFRKSCQCPLTSRSLVAAHEMLQPSRSRYRQGGWHERTEAADFVHALSSPPASQRGPECRVAGFRSPCSPGKAGPYP